MVARPSPQAAPSSFRASYAALAPFQSPLTPQYSCSSPVAGSPEQGPRAAAIPDAPNASSQSSADIEELSPEEWQKSQVLRFTIVVRMRSLTGGNVVADVAGKRSRQTVSSSPRKATSRPRLSSIPSMWSSTPCGVAWAEPFGALRLVFSQSGAAKPESVATGVDKCSFRAVCAPHASESRESCASSCTANVP